MADSDCGLYTSYLNAAPSNFVTTPTQPVFRIRVTIQDFWISLNFVLLSFPEFQVSNKGFRTPNSDSPMNKFRIFFSSPLKAFNNIYLNKFKYVVVNSRAIKIRHFV